MRKEGAEMKLGMVTYQLGKDWDVPTLIEKLATLKYQGVELRTEHAHGVEDTLTKEQRAEVRRRFAESPVEVVGLGTTFEYHALDPQVVRQNVEGTPNPCVIELLQVHQVVHGVGVFGQRRRHGSHDHPR